MHAFCEVAHSSTRRHRLFARFRTAIDELRRPAVASQRQAMPRSLGLSRTSICLRVFDKFYSMARVYERRG